MREILKIVVEMKMPPYHKGMLREPMFELGVGLLHDEGWQKGMYYIAMRLVSRFAETKDEKIMSLEAIGDLMARSNAEDKSLCNASSKVASKIKKSIAKMGAMVVLFASLLTSCSTDQPKGPTADQVTDQEEADLSVLEKVDVFVGTSEMGHVYPGATVPFEMVQLSPDSDTIPFLHEGRYTGDVYRYCAGYQYSDSSIVGFSHTHFSGTDIFSSSAQSASSGEYFIDVYQEGSCDMYLLILLNNLLSWKRDLFKIKPLLSKYFL